MQIMTQQPPTRMVLLTVTNHMSLLDAALYYASLGVKVFPLQPGTKLPMPGWSWKRLATTDPETIRGWWGIVPDANIALAMGGPWDCLDVDMKGGQNGLRSYQAITQEKFLGPVQQTPSGGQHLILAHTPGLINFTHKGDLGGLDYRTTGGYIVAAPSRTPEGNYFWLSDGIIDAPHPAVMTAIQQWSTQSNTKTVEAPDIPEDLIDYHTLNLDQRYLNYLDSGDYSPWNNDESRAIFAVAGALQQRLQNPGLVYGILAANPWVWACAERHRPFGNVGDWLWKYGIGKMVTQATRLSVDQVFSPIPGASFSGATAPIMGATAPPMGADQDLGDNKTPSLEKTPSFFAQASEATRRAQFAPQWIVRGLIEKGQVGLVYGDSQALKSYLMLDLAMTIAQPPGASWHGHQVVDPGPVWFLAGEGNQILWRRLEALRQARGLSQDDLQDLWISSGGLNLMNPQHLQFLKDQLEACGGKIPRVILIDTLSSNAIIDENNARDAAQVIQLLYAIAHEWGCTIILVHHAGKSNNRSVRGSSVFANNTDFRIQMERIPGREIMTQATVEKLKGAPEPKDPLVFTGKIRPLVGVLDDEFAAVTDLVLERVSGDAIDQVRTARVQAKLTHHQAEVYGVIKTLIQERWTIADPGEGMLRDELLAGYRSLDGNAGADASNFYRTLNKLIGRGVLVLETVGDVDIIKLPQGVRD